LERSPTEYSSPLGTELLIDVFAERDSFTPDEQGRESWIGDVLLDSHPFPTKIRRMYPETSQYTIVERATFLSQWNTFTHNAFANVNWENIFVAGGAVLGTILQNPVQHAFHNSDIDIFVHGLSAEEATKKIFEICNLINKNIGGSGHVLVSQHSVTLLGIYPFRHVQFVLRLYRWENFPEVWLICRNISEVLIGFDVDCCSVGFDGKTVYAIPRSRRAINLKCEFLKNYSYKFTKAM
jgi:hypothetical protein